MILSLNHLNKFLPNKKLTPQEVEVALNEIGLEVEEIKPFSDVQGLLFGKVLDVYPNPNSDRLDIVKLETKDGIFQIQTNNRILKPGNLTICFPIGAKKGTTTFGEVVLKGEKSQGMMAAFSEIGYNWELLEEANQLLILPNDFASIHDDPITKLGLDDFLIEISVTANRNDANSYYVLARELASYFETEFVFDLKQIPDSFQTKLTSNPNLASLLSFTEVKGHKETSFEDKLLLAKHGISSKFSWAVNLTNLCLINIGVPAHVYDRSKIGDNLTTKLYSGKLTILGNKEVEVKDALAIYDENGPISLVSVMGLEKHKADLATTDFVFEIGLFNPKMIRHNSKEIKLISNAATQGSRRISFELANLATDYIRSYCQGLEVSNTVQRANKDQLAKKKIQFNEQALKQYSNIDDLSVFDKAKSQLAKLGYEFIEDYILVPNYRYDVNIFEDIIEELFRFYSYKNFKPEPIENITLATQKRDISKFVISKLGYNEARTFTLVSTSENWLNPFNFEKSVKLLTFVSKEREEIRNSIVTSLQKIVEYNQKRKLNNINFFEKGMINDNKIVYGFASTTKTFDQLKQDLINLTGLTNLEFSPFKDNEYIHPNASAKIHYNNKMVGWLGKIHPAYDNTNAFYLEFEAELINQKTAAKFEQINYNPLKTIDLTFELSYQESIKQVLDKIKAVAHVFDIQEIDDYQKEETHNLTLRITADDYNIQLLIDKFNE
ncbi:phenylalanine--tRNA ligase subunit beta [Mycoplasmopsis gallopavonis]|uniref:Phenylalanine--tRNA ligase beta subunit n=1 Tax=Mycoplasmopsis gallopavonis TaxID=76629 RepID=A0A449AZ08_9BACT|nr:phenylalanine--tRNA ligase subunit beta [Mycoplasmopsis gallopavonis]RIV16925.1 phenylalanine--tRNA ligase subunit beta [Mycoplasmopsis gallopavonis]VEU72740.1 Phenylalanine--tRNA ligase beta subunit [Mycoplasmopsis gallopavonis]